MQDKEKDLSADLASARSNVNDALLDSIDLSSALDALFNLVRNVNRYMNEREASAVKGQRCAHPSWRGFCLPSSCTVPWCHMLVEASHGCNKKHFEGLVANALVML